MTALVPAPTVPARCGLRNLAAIAIAAAAAGFLYLQFDPIPSGISPEAAGIDVGTLTAELDQSAETTQPVSLEEAGDEVGGSSPGPLPIVPAPARPLEGRAALEHDLARLEQAHDRVSRLADYTATFCRCERKGSQLGETDVTQLKVRHQPFSFYMKWLNGDVDREVMFVEGQNGGEMLVKLGGLRGRLLPTLHVNPNGAVAMRECRHPATEVGLLHLTRRMIGYRRRDVAQADGITCRVIPDGQFQQRACDVVVIEYDRPELSPDYRKTLHYIDRELGIPVLVKSYGWPAEITGADPSRLDETTLVEQYAYTNIRLNPGLSVRDFDRDSPHYRFSR
ncbi:MAG TPA: DUF1571 domain-containing protein [Planctomycetaceae bacterium]|nr:DUF1571 domain-containing protein [Planctomycetaceae bacterium]